MVDRPVKILANIDWVTVILVMLIISFGWISICGASADVDTHQLLSFSTRPGKQLLWIGCALLLAVGLLLVSSDFLECYAYLLYGLLILLLIVTIFVAKDTKGSYSWIDLKIFKIQPAEFSKFATALALSKYLSNHNVNLSNIRHLTKAVLIFLLPMLIIVMQKETGSAIVYLAFFLVLYREGMDGSVLWVGFCMVLFFILRIRFADVSFEGQPYNLGTWIVLLIIQVVTAVLVWINAKEVRFAQALCCVVIVAFLVGFSVSMLIIPFNVTLLQLILIGISLVMVLFKAFKDMIREYIYISIMIIGSVGYLYSVDYLFNNVLESHHQDRIYEILGLRDDPYGVGYNVNQSKIAIGSGGFLGKGFMQGTQTKLKYVPEQDTDFIFCTVGEEQGFVGATSVLLLYLVLMLRIVYLSELQPSSYGRVFGYSVASIIFFHIFINIGMVLGITPVIGIPLPMFSYGGSSLWGFTILLSLFLRMDCERVARG